VFVMSSTYEPLGQTILESAACGMRIAAFSRSAGVETATHELDIDHLIDYSSTLDGQGLARAMRRSISTTVSRNDAHEKNSAIVYSWENLWEMLTIKE
jgi:1,2-diacylglycerol 3-alpha-glucosyltransferase